MNTQSWPDGPISIPSPFPKYAQDIESYNISQDPESGMWCVFCDGQQIRCFRDKESAWSFLEGILFGGVQ